VYVTNETGGTVSVIDTAANTVVGSAIPVGVRPNGIAVNPAGTRVYVTNFGSSAINGNTVSVINIENDTNTVIGSAIPVGVRPLDVAVNPAGTRVYVTNNTENTVSVIDTATNTVVATITVGSGPREVAVNPAGTRVYVTNNTENTVSVIDTATNTVLGSTITVGLAPVGIAVNRAGTRVYVANFLGGTVSVISVSSPLSSEVSASEMLVGSPGIFLYIAGSPGRLVEGTPVYHGSAGIAPNTSYTLSVQSMGARALTRTVLATGVTNGRGHVERRIEMGVLAPGAYKIVMTGSHPLGYPLVLTNHIVVDAAGKFVSVSAESQQPILN
jgi:YVTN family beta-propeller protein